MLSDHLGSTSTLVDQAGTVQSQQYYLPYGLNRGGPFSTLTTKRFTGQYHEAALGLYFYGARWYDPLLGRFTQADTIIPDPAAPQAFNRYAYTLNNPLRYTDPSGHCIPGWNCPGDQPDDGAPPDNGGGGGNSTSHSPQQANPNPTKGGRNTSSRSMNLGDWASNTAEVLDFAALSLSIFEAGASDFVIVALTGLGCVEGPEGCAAGLALGGGFDFYMATASPFAIAENGLGAASFALTVFSDVVAGNTNLSFDSGMRIGGDTIVSGRNLILGVVPESNADYVVNLSQFIYDEKRRTGKLPARSTPITDWKEILKQFFWDNTPWNMSSWQFSTHIH